MELLWETGLLWPAVSFNVSALWAVHEVWFASGRRLHENQTLLLFRNVNLFIIKKWFIIYFI